MAASAKGFGEFIIHSTYVKINQNIGSEKTKSVGMMKIINKDANCTKGTALRFRKPGEGVGWQISPIYTVVWA